MKRLVLIFAVLATVACMAACGVKSIPVYFTDEYADSTYTYGAKEGAVLAVVTVDNASRLGIKDTTENGGRFDVEIVGDGFSARYGMSTTRHLEGAVASVEFVFAIDEAAKQQELSLMVNGKAYPLKTVQAP